IISSSFPGLGLAQSGSEGSIHTSFDQPCRGRPLVGVGRRARRPVPATSAFNVFVGARRLPFNACPYLDPEVTTCSALPDLSTDAITPYRAPISAWSLGPASCSSVHIEACTDPSDGDA
ncbi:MAG: hypothetical protein OXN90_13740, partial [Gemmatimonadota bacterium]|nr:hypothetical protein [Gemmatimonadota bacterium]